MSPAQARKVAMPPPFPAVVLQLIRQLQDPAVGAAEVSKLIQLDPTLTASLLRLVNSPFFGLRRQIASVAEAVMVLGMSAARRMVMSLAVAVPLRRAGVDAVFASARWQHTVSCAALARRLVVGDPASAEMAFTAGLLHDMGQVVLLHEHGEACVRLHAEAAGGDVRPLEVARFGRAHDALGAELMEAWGLPQAIADAARSHHAAPPISGLTLVQQAVWVAHQLAGAPAQAAQIAALCPDCLAPPAQVLAEARSEIETLAGLLNE